MARYRGGSAGLAAFAAVLAFGLSTASAFATFPGANGRIAYNVVPNEGSPAPGIYTINPDGSDPRRIAPANSGSPSWSPNGRRIVFDRSINGHAWIYVMGANGKDARRIPHVQGGSPSFAPNGQRIVYVRGHHGPVIATIRLDGTGVRKLADCGIVPEYSPDGKHIVFQGCDPLGVWVMRRDGSHAHVLAVDRQARNPHYRPDGRRIIYGECLDRCFASQVFIMHPDGSHVHPFPSGDNNCPQAVTDLTPVYSPDGEFIAYGQWDGGHPGSDPLVSNLWMAGADCGNAHAITQYNPNDPRVTGAGVFNPSWQPLPTG
jgi:TolB protein